MQSTDEVAVPVTVTATVVETRPERGGLAFVAKVFSDIKPKVTTAAINAIDSSARAAAEGEKKSSAFDAEAAYTDSLSNELQAIVAYCHQSSSATDAPGAIDRIAKSAAARSAQLKSRSDAIKAGDNPSRDPLVVVDDQPVANSSNQSVCTGR
ncbi:hypothetical protein [Luteibacter sp. RCC_6_2]|uniref:hypothetical protein n=1 Tax=Luteibacter sp. RCC_6_2 TaxID=3239223 RepID=UPI0035239AD3